RAQRLPRHRPQPRPIGCGNQTTAPRVGRQCDSPGSTHMQMLKLLLPFSLLASVLAVAVPIGGAKAASSGPGGCGEYMYLHEGHCVDARQKSPTAWSESMGRRPVW